MKMVALGFIAFLLVLVSYSTQASGADLTLTAGGRVTVELISSDAAFSNTLSIVSPNVAIATDTNGNSITGCSIVHTGFGGVELLSEKTSQHGCRVELDADPAQAGIQPFASGDVVRFNLCAQTGTVTTCNHVWSSEPSLNSDKQNHVNITTSQGGNYNLLAWEDRDNLGDQDFNDLIAVVRVVQDTDGDGLWDDWEQSGIDTDGDGTVDFILPGANVNHKDIYLEIDYMDCAVTNGDCAATDTHTHRPKQAAINAVIQAFTNAPVPNPDGIQGITLHVDVDDAIPHQDYLFVPNLCFIGTAGTGFDAVKNNPAYFGPNNPRRYAYHYMLFTHQQVSNGNWSGCAELPGNDIQVALGAWNYQCTGGANAGQDCLPAHATTMCPNSTCAGLGDLDGDNTDDQDVGTVQQQAGTLMHELGHNLGLWHGGAENDNTNYKPNYISIMNYRFQMTGIPPTGRIDYSREALPALDERLINGVGRLNETQGIGDGTDDTQYVCPDSTVRTGTGNGAIDWNCDNDNGQDTNVSVNINGDCTDTNNNGSCDASEPQILGVLAGFDDWENIRYTFQNTGDFEDGMHSSSAYVLPDMDYPTYLKVVNRPPVADAGPDQTVECTASTGATVILDASASYDPDGDPLTYTWKGPLETKTGVMVQMQLPLGRSCVALEVNDGRNGTSGDTMCVMVRDTTAPVLNATLSPSLLWPANHKMVNIAADITVSDVCDLNPVVRLISLVSNEPDNGPGDGDFPNDIQNANIGTDDRSFSLRAERAGTGDGRIYTVTYQATDASNNTTLMGAQVMVPHDKAE